MDLIDDVDPIPTRRRHVPDIFPQLPDFVDAAIGGSVDLLDIHRGAGGDFKAGDASVAGVPTVSLEAVDGLGEDSGNRCLSHAPWTTEKIGMGQPLVPDGVHQRLGDVRLADDVFKFVWAPFSG
jgi:hypothetical protein